MITRRSAFVPLLLLVLLTPCFAHHMAIVVNKENAVGEFTSAELGKVVRAEMKKWPDGKSVVLVLHKNSTGESETLERLNRMSASEWKALLAEHKNSILLVDSDEDVLKAVRSMPGAIGMIEVHSVDNTIKVVRVDGKLPMQSGYLPH
jgi:ABC-type phosphate transport system substrate-binding protein